jgi:hypothetical protein
MRRNNRITGRICTVAALAVVIACGILAPSAFTDSAVASAATRSTPP